MQNRFKRLAIISDCIHMYNNNGAAVTEVHIFCRQMQALAAHFEYTYICCPFVNYTSEKVTTAYDNASIKFIPLKNAGGNSLRAKLGILSNFPNWLKGFKKARNAADIIYMRFPNNLNILGYFYFALSGKKKFATYTGTWTNYNGEPATYRFQKWLLKHFFKGPVWVYMHEEQRGGNIFKGISPSYTLNEWEEETIQVQERLVRLKTTGIQAPVFITVGVYNSNKNQQFILNACKVLRDEGFNFYLYVVGDGELKQSYEQFVIDNNLQNHVEISGKKNYTQLRELYRKCDFLIQATKVEGFGKVPIEGFFHGVIPILNKVALADEMTGNGTRGFLFSAEEVNNLVILLKNIVSNQSGLGELILRGREYAKNQTLENWANNYIKVINATFSK